MIFCSELLAISRKLLALFFNNNKFPFFYRLILIANSLQLIANSL